jgi:hypothetical protein
MMNMNLKLTILFLGMFINTSYAVDKKSHLDPPGIIKNPAKTVDHPVESRKFTGISSLAVSQEGRFWAVWYTGPTPAEDANNYVVLATSYDKGETWDEILAIDPDGSGPVRAFDPEVWMAPDGKLWVFWAQQVQPARSTNCGVWAMNCSNPGSSNPEWTEPVRLADGVMMCKPVILSTGEWALPVSFWHLWEESAKIVVSNDNGKTWIVRGGVNVPREVRNHDEHMIVERKDGSLWMLVRTLYGIGESFSYDSGYSWTPLVPSKIQHPAARFFISRLNSGNLLLVKHGPVDMKIQRSHLFAFISKDDGHSWSGGLLIDERPGVSYPDGQQFSDGMIYITYDFSRTKDQNILMTSFSEEEITGSSSRKILEVYKRRRIISRGGVK